MGLTSAAQQQQITLQHSRDRNSRRAEREGEEKNATTGANVDHAITEKKSKSHFRN